MCHSYEEWDYLQELEVAKKQKVTKQEVVAAEQEKEPLEPIAVVA